MDIKLFSGGQKKSCGFCCTKIENFSVSFNKKIILDNINIHIHCGELTSIIGPNGAGKSTLLKAILGRLKHKGSLRFLDYKDNHSNKPVIGYVPQHLNFDRTTPASVYDLFTGSLSTIPVWLFQGKGTRAKVIEALKTVQAEHLIDQKIGNLSGGEIQRVMLALALHPVPDLLLLDEPVSGIDEPGLKLFYKILSDLKEKMDLSIVLVSHDLEMVAQYSNRVILLNKTILQAGPPREVYTSTEFNRIFGHVWSQGLFQENQ